MLVSVTVDWAIAPCLRVSTEGLVDIRKSGPVTSIGRVKECESDAPLVPVTVTEKYPLGGALGGTWTVSVELADATVVERVTIVG